jgi:tetratricopeptide (TPR) repeat protein
VNVATLIGQAEEALESDDLETALRLGQQLIEARHTFGFEAMARAHYANGDTASAFAILERGVKEAPHVWTLWHLLGNYASDADDFARAFSSYDRALACDRVEAEVVHLNYATDLHRAGRHEDALERLEQVRDPEYATPAGVVRADALNALGRHKEALAAARQTLDAADGNADDVELARLYCAMAEALRGQGNMTAALDACWKAIEYDRENERAIAVLREVEGRFSAEAKYFRLVVKGRPKKGRGAAQEGFLMKADVVADDPEEALYFLNRLEPPESRGTLGVEEVEMNRSATADQPKGVYWSSPRAFYLEEKG